MEVGPASGRLLCFHGVYDVGRKKVLMQGRRGSMFRKRLMKEKLTETNSKADLCKNRIGLFLFSFVLVTALAFNITAFSFFFI